MFRQSDGMCPPEPHGASAVQSTIHLNGFARNPLWDGYGAFFRRMEHLVRMPHGRCFRPHFGTPWEVRTEGPRPRDRDTASLRPLGPPEEPLPDDERSGVVEIASKIGEWWQEGIVRR